MKKIIALFALIMLALPHLAFAQSIPQERLRFAPGRTQTTVSDRIVGREIIDYVFDAQRGQTLSVRFAPTSPFAFFNLLAPNGEALFVGQDVANPAGVDARLGASGTYTIRIYLVRAEARRGGRSDFRLTVSITGGAPKPFPDSGVGIPEEGGPDFYVVAGLARGELLNMRRGPSVTDGVITKLANGKIVKNLGCRKIGTSRWCQVQNPKIPAQRGWANGRFLREAGAPQPDVVIDENPVPIIPDIPEDGGPDFYAVSGLSQGDTLSMRVGPSRTQDLVARFPNGTILQNLGCRSVAGVRWCQLQNPNNRAQRGWVNGRYLRESEPPRREIEDERVTGIEFNATGEVACAIAGFPRATRCPFGVVRRGLDQAIVYITLPNGRQRVLEFESGRIQSLSGIFPLSYRQIGDEYVINIDNGQERFTIFDAVINGG
jgi:uncharacterized protein YraI